MPVKGKYIMKSLLGFRHSDTVEKRRGWGGKRRKMGFIAKIFIGVEAGMGSRRLLPRRDRDVSS